MPEPSVADSSTETVGAAHLAHVPLAQVTRGSAVESIHYGSVAVVDRQGRLLAAAGDPTFLTMTRSSLKPFQAMPFVAAGGPERFGYSKAQIALLCASHSGEPRHVEAVADMLARAGNSPGHLQCGTHAPYFYEVRGEVPPPPPYSPLAHNCSGKHSGMLAYCVHCGYSRDSYLAVDHPLQQAIRRAVSRYTGAPESELVAGIDGCSAPNYGVALARLAQAFARLAAADTDAEFGNAPRVLADAMATHPEMVSGEHRSDFELTQAGRGEWIAKIGAEGVQGIGVRGAGVGIAIKIIDGNRRALPPIIAAVLDQLGLLDARRRAALAGWFEAPLRNYRGILTGHVRPTVVLDKNPSIPAAGRSPDGGGQS
ncbi:MAG TPA: asparaginase [Casimicrobiaceae bacterium]|nr:asparaginase [Casimicrobiaceae bacterium]